MRISGFSALLLFALIVKPCLAASSRDALVARLESPMTAVAAAMTEEKWRPRLDDVVQAAPGGVAQAIRWSAEQPAWQRARTALDARVAPFIEVWRRSAEPASLLRAELYRLYPANDAASLATMLEGPAGGSIIRREAAIAFISTAMAADASGPKAGDAASMERMRTLSRRFDERAGSGLPPDDEAQAEEVNRFSADPAGRKFAELWRAVLGKMQVKLDGGINLLLFDQRAAIARDIAEAARRSEN
jgi:hypothetical protein